MIAPRAGKAWAWRWLGVLAATWLPSAAEAQVLISVGAAAGSASAPATATTADEEEEEEFVDEYASSGPRVSDPFERVNRTLFKFNDSVYDKVLRPVANGYEAVVPAPARRGLVSFFDNIRYPVRLAGCLLQGKLDRAAAETGKFALNSTVGLAGFIKVSDRYPALQVPEEDIGQALGAWGIPPGPFLVLPILGPSSLRDGIGRVGDYYATPLNWEFVEDLDDWVEISIHVTDTVSSLPDLLEMHASLKQAALDPYVAFRNAYLQYREGEVRR